VQLRYCSGFGRNFLAVLHAPQVRAPSDAHFANAEDAAAVSTGKMLYRRHYATCHGRYLQGQPLWQLDQESSVRRAIVRFWL